MEDRQPETPVALFIFNRPDATKRVMDAIRSVKPRQLFVVADGPREDHGDDESRCTAAREIATSVDWECELYTNFADENMGLFDRFTTGLNWVFDAVDRTIILEDDCLPNRSFFQFCGALLDRYATDERIMAISGTNELGEWKSDRRDYHFARHESVWGWATWRDAWEQYDAEMATWATRAGKEALESVFCDRAERKWRERLYHQTYTGDIDSWAFRWSYSMTMNSGLAVVPAKNLVSNIGFGDDATNLTDESSERAAVQRYELSFPLEHPDVIVPDRSFDRAIYRNRTNWYERALYRYLPLRSHLRLSESLRKVF